MTAIEAPQPAVTTAALRLDDISAGYESTAVLHGISIEVPTGGTVALIGPNGAGKTTLLKVASGLLRPSGGRLEVAGADVTGQRAEELARLGVCHVPEGRGVYRSLSVRENLRLQSPRGSERDSIQRAVEVFPVLGRKLGQTAGTMSGGEQQMLALAAAYIRDPAVVLIDEPSLGLAPVIVDVVFESLARLESLGTSLLLVDQFATRVLEMASTAYVLRRGHVVYAGSSADLLKRDLFSQYLGTEPVTAEGS
ncbi:MAG: branched-chain amino acid transporter ATPase [Massilia sp.]|nr:branched-chain amino acid transporter ATPase [Massilia sp.]